jgi:hypothetical protein
MIYKNHLRTLISFFCYYKKYSDKFDEEFNQYIAFICIDPSDARSGEGNGLFQRWKVKLATIDCNKVVMSSLGMSAIMKEKMPNNPLGSSARIFYGYPTEIRLIFQT